MRAEGVSLRLPNPTDMDSSEGNHRERFRQRHELFDNLDESERRAVQDASQTLKFDDASGSTCLAIPVTGCSS